MDLSRLTDVPMKREAPPEWVRAFREIDERVELIYIGKGKWWVGIVYENIPLIEIGRQELVNIKEAGGATGPTTRLARLKAAGWRRVLLWDVDPVSKDWVQLTTPGDANGWARMVSQFRKQNDLYLKDPDNDAAYQRLLLRHEMGEMSGKLEETIAQVLDYVRSEKKFIMRKVRGSKIFTGLGGILRP